MKVLISGSHGFIGEALVSRLEEGGHRVTRLVRGTPQPSELSWDSLRSGTNSFTVDGFDAVIHLGGVKLGDKRWNEKERGRIWDSRINTTETLAASLAEAIDRPEVFIVASGMGFYGDRGSEQLDETSSKGEGFLAEVCYNWEDAAGAAREAGIRTVHLRTGIVLGAGGGMIERLAPVFRTMMGGKLGPGTQYMSWIALHDEVEAIVFALEHKDISGPINLCSPNPVTNAEFTKTFGEVLHRPTFIPVWPWLLNLAFGKQLTAEMLLVSQRAYPAKLTDAGFTFAYRHLAPALRDIMAKADANPEEDSEAEDQETAPLVEPKRKSRLPKILRFDEPKASPSARNSDEDQSRG